MKFLQKVLHLTLIFGILLAPMDLSWAMEEEGENDNGFLTPSIQKKDTKGKDTKGKEKASTNRSNCLNSATDDDSETDDDIVEGYLTDVSPSCLIQAFKQTLEDTMGSAAAEIACEKLFSETRSKRQGGRNRFVTTASATRYVEPLTSIEVSFKKSLREIGIIDRMPALVFVYDKNEQEQEPPPPLSDTLVKEAITKRKQTGKQAGSPDFWGKTNTFFTVLDQEFWLKSLHTPWKTKTVQIFSALWGFGPSSALTAMTMFEVGYYFDFQDIDSVANTVISWLTITLSPPLVRQLYERGKKISQTIFCEEAFPPGKEDSRPHVYKHNWLHTLTKVGVGVCSFFNAAVFVGFFVLDVEDVEDPPISKGDIAFTSITGLCLLASLWELFYSNYTVWVDREFRDRYEEGTNIQLRRRILLDKINEVHHVVNQACSTDFINTLFGLIVGTIKELKEKEPSLNLLSDDSSKAIAVTSLLFKNVNRISSHPTHKKDMPQNDDNSEELSLRDVTAENDELQTLVAKAQNFQADLDDTRKPSWWQRGLGFVGELVVGARIYTQYLIANHVTNLILGACNLDESIATPIAIVTSVVLTAIKTGSEYSIIKKWFQSLPSLFSLKQDMVGVRKIGKGVSLINGSVIALLELVIAEFAYPDLSLTGKIFLFGANAVGTGAVFDRFLSEKSDNGITGILTLDCFQKIQSPRLRRVFINYWIQQLEEIVENLDGETIQVIYSKTQNAA